MSKIIVPPQAYHLVKTLYKAGYMAYLVGGCVRDSLMGREPKDWDITTSATPDQVKELFEHVIPTGEKHGTVTVLMGATKEAYEVTTFRSDGNYSDGRRPDNVDFIKNIDEDLARRDFTMNAIAYDPIADEFIDPFGGINHIENGLIHCVGDPADRFREDALRMMRLIRFEAQLNFIPQSKALIVAHSLADTIQNVSFERIRDELTKILLSPKPSQAIGELYMVRLMDFFLPELGDCAAFNQHSPYHSKDVFEHILDVVDGTPPELKVRLGALFHDIGKPQTFSKGEDGVGHFYGHPKVGADIARNVMTRLRFPNDLIDDVCTLVLYHMDRVEKLRTPNIKRFMNRVGEHNLPDLFALMRADIAAHKGDHDYSQVENLEAETARIIAERPPMVLKDLSVKGKDLIERGLKPGPVIGEILNAMMEFVIENPEANNKDDLMQFAREKLLIPV